MNNQSKGVCETPYVSIIVTTFNRINLLKETLTSILEQSYTNFELIVVDNMSTDGTNEYFSEINDSRVRYFRNPNDGVIAVNRNYGIQKAQGKYIAFCDDDDLWLASKLKLQVDVLENNFNVVLCYTNAESFTGNQKIKPKMVRRVVTSNYFNNLLIGNFIPNSSVLIRRDVFKVIGLLTEDSSLREDYEMWLRVSRKYEIRGIDISLIRYRIHHNNIAGNRVHETLRAIRTVRSIVNLLNVPAYLAWSNIAFQLVKCFYYLVVFYMDSLQIKMAKLTKC